MFHEAWLEVESLDVNRTKMAFRAELVFIRSISLVPIFLDFLTTKHADEVSVVSLRKELGAVVVANHSQNACPS